MDRNTPRKTACKLSITQPFTRWKGEWAKKAEGPLIPFTYNDIKVTTYYGQSSMWQTDFKHLQHRRT